MKKIIILLIYCLLIQDMAAQTVVTIGTGTDSQPYPFNLWGGYSRSAALYTSGEIGNSGIITHLGWNVVTGDIENCPMKIFLKRTTDASLYATSWNNMINGATLVYNGTGSFPSTGWHTIDIADFVYISTGGYNLLVLCEANYGGNGAPSNPVFAWTYHPNKHESWQQYETPPLNPGVPDEKRPNIQVSWIPLTTPHPPSGFLAQASGTSQVDLSWIKNAANNNVLVAFNTVNIFGTPSGTYSAGNAIPGGGTVFRPQPIPSAQVLQQQPFVWGSTASRISQILNLLHFLRYAGQSPKNHGAGVGL